MRFYCCFVWDSIIVVAILILIDAKCGMEDDTVRE